METCFYVILPFSDKAKAFEALDAIATGTPRPYHGTVVEAPQSLYDAEASRPQAERLADECHGYDLEGNPIIDLPASHECTFYNGECVDCGEQTLTYRELSTLAIGTRVVLADNWDLFPVAIVPAGTIGIVTANDLNEIACDMWVLPHDESVRRDLQEWDGHIQFAPYGTTAEAWDEATPVALLTSYQGSKS